MAIYSELSPWTMVIFSGYVSHYQRVNHQMQIIAEDIEILRNNSETLACSDRRSFFRAGERWISPRRRLMFRTPGPRRHNLFLQSATCLSLLQPGSLLVLREQPRKDFWTYQYHDRNVREMDTWSLLIWIHVHPWIVAKWAHQWDEDMMVRAPRKISALTSCWWGRKHWFPQIKIDLDDENFEVKT